MVSYAIFLFYQFSPIGVALGLYGWWRGRPLAPDLWHSALALYLVYLLFGLLYRVSDQFAFFLGAHIFWAVAMGMGVAHLAGRLSPWRRRWLAAGLALHIALMPFLYAISPTALRAAGITETEFGIPQVGNGVRDGLAYYLDPNKRGDRQAYAFGQEVLQQLPPQTLVIAEWYVDTDEYFILRYFAAVEGMRPDVQIVGWPTVDPFLFNSQLAVQQVEEALGRRPVYLASLSQAYYAAETLLQRFCVVPQDHLYRVYMPGEVGSEGCLSPDDAAE